MHIIYTLTCNKTVSAHRCRHALCTRVLHISTVNSDRSRVPCSVISWLSIQQMCLEENAWLWDPFSVAGSGYPTVRVHHSPNKEVQSATFTCMYRHDHIGKYGDHLKVYILQICEICV